MKAFNRLGVIHVFRRAFSGNLVPRPTGNARLNLLFTLRNLPYPSFPKATFGLLRSKSAVSEVPERARPKTNIHCLIVLAYS